MFLAVDGVFLAVDGVCRSVGNAHQDSKSFSGGVDVFGYSWGLCGWILFEVFFFFGNRWDGVVVFLVWKRAN